MRAPAARQRAVSEVQIGTELAVSQQQIVTAIELGREEMLWPPCSQPIGVSMIFRAQGQSVRGKHGAALLL